MHTLYMSSHIRTNIPGDIEKLYAPTEFIHPGNLSPTRPLASTGLIPAQTTRSSTLSRSLDNDAAGFVTSLMPSGLEREKTNWRVTRAEVAEFAMGGLMWSAAAREHQSSPKKIDRAGNETTEETSDEYARCRRRVGTFSSKTVAYSSVLYFIHQDCPAIL